MINVTATVQDCFSHSKQHFANGSYELGMALYVRGSELLKQVPHPLDFLELVVVQADLLTNNVLPALTEVSSSGESNAAE